MGGASDLVVQLRVGTPLPVSGIQGRCDRFSSSEDGETRSIPVTFYTPFFRSVATVVTRIYFGEGKPARFTRSAADPHKSTCRFLRQRLQRTPLVSQLVFHRW